jgi:hypothetical protein
MNINLRVTFADSTSKSVVAKAADIVAFEERFNISMASLQKDVRFTHLLFLAWHAEKRSGETKEDFEKWLDSVEAIEADEAKK